MDWVETLKDINYVAVVVAALSSYAVGMIWYAPGVFGSVWMKEIGLSKKDTEDKSKMMHAMVHSGIASLISTAVLSALMLATRTDGAANGAVFGAVVGFGIAMSAMVTHDVFSQKSKKLTKINGLHDVVKFAAFGAIIGGFGF